MKELIKDFQWLTVIIKRLYLRAKGYIEIEHWLEYPGKDGAQRITEREWIPETAMMHLDSKYVMRFYHAPWLKQQYMKHFLYQYGFNVDSGWERVEK